MREGGLDAQFFSIWVEPQYYGGSRAERAVERADEQIKAVRALAEQHPETWILATTARRRSARGARRRKAGGRRFWGSKAATRLMRSSRSVERYYKAGVRYMSPAWSLQPELGGLFGRRTGAQHRPQRLRPSGVIREMNRLGIMVDVSHVSDKTFWDIVETSVESPSSRRTRTAAPSQTPRAT